MTLNRITRRKVVKKRKDGGLRNPLSLKVNDEMRDDIKKYCEWFQVGRSYAVRTLLEMGIKQIKEMEVSDEA